jgi:hypothetical protein
MGEPGQIVPQQESAEQGQSIPDGLHKDFVLAVSA